MTTDNAKRPTKRRRRPKPGDIASLRRVLWAAIRDLETLTYQPPDDVTLDQRLRAVHALATISGQYLRATEQHDLVARIEALEAAAAERTAPSGPTWRAA